MKREDLGILSPEELVRQPSGSLLLTIAIEGIPREITVDCYGKHYAYAVSTAHDPGQNGGFAIEAVTYGDVDITHLFSDAQLDAMAREVGAQ